MTAPTRAQARAVREAARIVLTRRTLRKAAQAGPGTERGPMRMEAWQADLCDRLEEQLRWCATAGAAKAVRVVLVAAPSGEGKSEIVSKRAPVWGMAELGLSFAVASYGADLATRNSVDARRYARSEEYVRLWPHLGASRDETDGHKDREEWWTVPAREGAPIPYIARGRRGALLGRHPNVIVLDDLYADGDDYESGAARRQVDTFLRTSVLSRMSAHGGLVIDMGTRWGMGDTKEWWRARQREAEARGQPFELVELAYPLRGSEPWRHGPQGYLTASWTEQRESQMRGFYGRWHRAILDCDPTDSEGGMFTRSKHLCHTYRGVPSEVARQCAATYLAVDAAETEGGGDWTVIQWWGLRHGKALMLGQRRGQWDELGVVRELRAEIERRNPSGVLIEKASAGKWAIGALRRAQIPRVRAVVPRGSKRSRIDSTLFAWANGDVLLPEPGPGAEWCYEQDDEGRNLIDRLCALRGETPSMDGEVDDEADAAALFLRAWADQQLGGRIRAMTGTRGIV